MWQRKDVVVVFHWKGALSMLLVAFPVLEKCHFCFCSALLLFSERPVSEPFGSLRQPDGVGLQPNQHRRCAGAKRKRATREVGRGTAECQREHGAGLGSTQGSLGVDGKFDLFKPFAHTETWKPSPHPILSRHAQKTGQDERC